MQLLLFAYAIVGLTKSVASKAVLLSSVTGRCGKPLVIARLARDMRGGNASHQSSKSCGTLRTWRQSILTRALMMYTASFLAARLLAWRRSSSRQKRSSARGSGPEEISGAYSGQDANSRDPVTLMMKAQGARGGSAPKEDLRGTRPAHSYPTSTRSTHPAVERLLQCAPLRNRLLPESPMLPDPQKRTLLHR